MLHKQEIEEHLTNPQAQYNRIRRKKQHERMGDFIAACRVALNPRKWAEELATKAEELEPVSAKVRGQVDDVNEEYTYKRKSKKGKHRSHDVAFTGEDTKVVGEAVGKPDGTKKEASQPPPKKPRHGTGAEVNDVIPIAENTKGRPENREQEQGPDISQPSIGRVDLTGNGNPTDNHPSKVPGDPVAFDAWFWRHQLQKALCSNTLPNNEVLVFPFISPLPSYFSFRKYPSSTSSLPRSRHMSK